MKLSSILLLIMLFLMLTSECLMYSQEMDEYLPAAYREKPRYAYYYTYDERNIGQVLHDAVLKRYSQTTNSELRYHVLKIGWNLMRVVKKNRKEINYRFYVLNTDEKFIISLPDGYIFLTEGLYNWLKSDDEIAIMLGHYIAHVEHKHDIQMLKKNNVYKRFVDRIDLANNSYSTIADNILTEYISIYKDHSLEYDSDKLGTEIAYLSGYDPWVFIDILSRLDTPASYNSEPEKNFYMHPPRLKRLDQIRYVLKEFEYMQRKHIRNLKHGHDENYYVNTGIKFARNNLYKDALYNFQAAVDVNPNTDVPHVNMGIIYAKMNYIGEAIACYRRAVDINPFNADTYYNMAIAFRRVENYEQALYCLEKCLALDPYHESGKHTYFKLKDYLNRVAAAQIQSEAQQKAFDDAFNTKDELLDELIKEHVQQNRKNNNSFVK